MVRSGAFVGRQQQLDELLGHWAAAGGGRGGLVVVGGEAGIGKTRLVERFTEHAAGAGATIAWGTCAGPDAPPLWPWRTILRELPTPPAASGGRTAVGELADPAGEQARIFAGLVERLRDVAAGGALVVVLDDLHWADPDSLKLLRLAAGAARRAPLLLVGTLRPDEAAASPAVRDLLADLASSTEVITLGGLADDAVAQLVAELVGRAPTAELTAAVVRRTAGNPFFVREVLRLVVAEGRLDAALADGALEVPPQVRDVLLRRVAQLPATARLVLEAAAVAGRRTTLPVLEHVVAAPLDGPGAASAADAVHRAADRAEAIRLVTVEGQELRFAHDLVREALVAGLDAGERRRLHLAVAGALRATATGTGHQASPAEIAGHLLDALPAGDPTEAAAAALAAGQEALDHRAPTDAVRHLERGLAALGPGSDPGALRASLLTTLGEARTVAGDRPGARAAHADAAALARAAGDADGLAVNALGFAGVMGSLRPDPERAALLEEALAALGARRDALTVRVTARLAHALLFADDPPRRLRLADEAVALAREIGDDGALAAALYVWNIVHITSANYAERLVAADELLALGRASGAEDTEAWALHFHAHHMAEGGDFAAFDADVAACDAIARRTRNATWQWTTLVHRTMRAAMQGRFDEAEALGDEAFGIGVRSQEELASATLGAHLVALRTWQGRLDELLPMMEAAAGAYPGLPAMWASIPYVHAELGRRDEAADGLRRILATRLLEDLPGAQSWTVALAMLARAAAVTGDAAVAGRVRDLLGPLGDRHVVGPFADCYFGPAVLYAGLCSTALGDHEAACAQLDRAVRQATAVGARPVAAWAAAELATAVDRAGTTDHASVHGISRSDDISRTQNARDLRAAAREELEALGMPRHLAALDADAEAAATGAEPGPAASTASAVANEFRRTAEGWVVGYDGRTVTLRPTKGLADIHRLVAAPGVELHVLELAQEADGPVPATPASGRQAVLDERAKAEYRARVLALEAEVDDARAAHDLGRAERAEAELDFVVAELAAALGLGGRDRSLADEAERARQAVRARIRYTLDRLGTVHAPLGRHLERSVVTGTFCSYRPERPTTWVTE